MNQSKFVARVQVARVQVAIGFGFPFHWLIIWREIFKLITKRSNCNHVVTFDSNLKTALTGSANQFVV